jgi:hypothetical protein
LPPARQHAAAFSPPARRTSSRATSTRRAASPEAAARALSIVFPWDRAAAAASAEAAEAALEKAVEAAVDSAVARVLASRAGWLPLTLAFIGGGLFFSAVLAFVSATYATGRENVLRGAATASLAFRRAVAVAGAGLGAARAALLGEVCVFIRARESPATEWKFEFTRKSRVCGTTHTSPLCTLCGGGALASRR